MHEDMGTEGLLQLVEGASLAAPDACDKVILTSMSQNESLNVFVCGTPNFHRSTMARTSSMDQIFHFRCVTGDSSFPRYYPFDFGGRRC